MKLNSTPMMPEAHNETPNEKGEAHIDKQKYNSTSIRVNVSLLDSLMTLAGELVLSRNQLLQTINSDDMKNAEHVGQRIDIITSELQETIMQTRMQPIDNVFSKFPRLTKEIAAEYGKQIKLHISGKDVELDRTILDSLAEPLAQVIRFCVSFGLETPKQRRKLGKLEEGRLSLNAYHEAGQVIVDVIDDGMGIDSDELSDLAVRKNVVTSEQARTLTEKERLHFAFQAKLFEDEGRDGKFSDMALLEKVKDDFERMDGTIDIQSEIGKGSTFTIKLPLTLAIIPCQIVQLADHRYAIPQVNLEELLRVPASQIRKQIEVVGNAEVVRLRGELLPIVRLADILGVKRSYIGEDGSRKTDRRHRIADRRSKAYDQDGQALQNAKEIKKHAEQRDESDRRQSNRSALNIVVVSTGGLKYGLIVDSLDDSEEIVIKPLGRHLQECKGYAGATIMGDGRVVLILDVGNLARMAELNAGEGVLKVVEKVAEVEGNSAGRREEKSLLIFRSSSQEQFAVPLSSVERIEKIKSTDIEDLGNKKVMQYRGGSLPLFAINDVAAVQPIADQDDLLVIVFKLRNKIVGMLATGPVDTVDTDYSLDDTTLKQTGIKGSTILNKQTTMFVDIERTIEVMFPEWLDAEQMQESV